MKDVFMADRMKYVGEVMYFSGIFYFLVLYIVQINVTDFTFIMF